MFNLLSTKKKKSMETIANVGHKYSIGFVGKRVLRVNYDLKVTCSILSKKGPK